MILPENEVETVLSPPREGISCTNDVWGMHMKLLETGEEENVRNPDDLRGS